PIFQNNSNQPQMEVERQLMIYLMQAGRYGTGAAADEIAEYTGVSVGSVYNCARRCMIAIMGLHGEAIKGFDPLHMEGARLCAEMKSGTSC
ncbi:hypothetical protein DAEQUDRAFT_660298, partial [Daedalea quercina L-15889]